MKNLIINIPFQGFYESLFGAELDAVEERFIDWEYERDNANIPSHALGDIVYRCADYGKAFDHIARAYAEYFNAFILDEYELDLGLKFESMQSPREYNFETDRIFCFITPENAQKLFDATSTPALRQAIAERFTSRSGFISSYPNDLEEWGADPTTWDHNQLGTLLVALLADAENYSRDILESMSDRNVFETAFDNCVNWECYESAKRELISEEAA